jgi:YbbR domain-containing protein
VRRRLVDALTNDLLLKLTAIGLAFLLWTTVTTPDPVAIDGIPVRPVIHDAQWAQLGDPAPATVTVEFTGPLRQLVRVATERPPMNVILESVSDSVVEVQLRPSFLALEAGMEDIRVEAIRPLSVTFRFDRVESRVVPVAVGIIGAPAPGFEQAGAATVEPRTVRLTGPRRTLDQLDTLRLVAIDLSRWTGTDTVPAVFEGLPANVTVDPTTVRVIVPVAPVDPDTTTAPAPSDTATVVPLGARPAGP